MFAKLGSPAVAVNAAEVADAARQVAVPGEDLARRVARRSDDRFRRHLRPGGTLVLNLFDPALQYLVAAERPSGGTQEVAIPGTSRRLEVSIGPRRNDHLRQVFTEEWTFRERDARGRVLREERETLSMRWSFRQEMRHLFEIAGFGVEAEYSDFRGSPPAYAGEQVWVLRKR